MNLTERISAFVQLGKTLSHFTSKKEWAGHSMGITEQEFLDFNHLILKAKVHNGWFTEGNVRKAIAGIVSMLDSTQINTWLNNYNFQQKSPKTIGVIMAGNIPMVGFHDMLCVLISGNHLQAKLSSDDAILLPAVVDLLFKIEPRFEKQVQFVTKLEGFDAVIATGSNNSARYFESYFGNYPNIIRKNRTSVAVFYGDEKESDLKAFADDVFLYFGMGCRNVTKLYLPKEFDLDKIFKAFYSYKEIINHNKYANNYDYNKAIYLMNQIELVENGFVLLKEDASLHSPLSVIHYEYYVSKEQLHKMLGRDRESIQCVVGTDHIPFGRAQSPNVWDYADNVDTLKFLISLN